VLLALQYSQIQIHQSPQMWGTGDSVLALAIVNGHKQLRNDRVDFSSFAAFKQTIEQIDFSRFLFGFDN